MKRKKKHSQYYQTSANDILDLLVEAYLKRLLHILRFQKVLPI